MKQTNARDAHKPAPSSPSEVIKVLKGMTIHEDKEHGKSLKREAPRSINLDCMVFPRVPFVNCRQFMYLVISLLVLRAGCGI